MSQENSQISRLRIEAKSEKMMGINNKLDRTGWILFARIGLFIVNCILLASVLSFTAKIHGGAFVAHPWLGKRLHHGLTVATVVLSMFINLSAAALVVFNSNNNNKKLLVAVGIIIAISFLDLVPGVMGIATGLRILKDGWFLWTSGPSEGRVWYPTMGQRKAFGWMPILAGAFQIIASLALVSIGHGYPVWSKSKLKQTPPTELPRTASPSPSREEEDVDWSDEKQKVDQREGSNSTPTTARRNSVLERMTYMTRLPLLAFAIPVFAYAVFYIGLLKNPFSGSSGVKHSFALLTTLGTIVNNLVVVGRIYFQTKHTVSTAQTVRYAALLDMTMGVIGILTASYFYGFSEHVDRPTSCSAEGFLYVDPCDAFPNWEQVEVFIDPYRSGWLYLMSALSASNLVSSLVSAITVFRDKRRGVQV
ncbi:hypothetical protein QBC43DRAFT_136406 [Cladorrhinum sp. PSN259]|nr:hypothetical protein QBC43DRAFT_136406 [Cladorrhinum sp. PSN259]